MTAQNTESQSQELVRMDANDLRAITTIEQAQALFAQSTGLQPDDASHEIGDGFALLDNKDRLLDVPFFILSWAWGKGDFGDDSEFVAVRLVTDRGDKVVVTDGGTGIYRQLRDYTDSHAGRQGGVMVKGGLRKSEYSNEFTDSGVTHYLNV